MAVFTITNEFVSGPDKNGKRKWMLQLQSLNYNDTVIQAGIDNLLPFAFGKNVAVQSVDAIHTGTLGVVLYGYFGIDGNRVQFLLPNKVTISAFDYFQWVSGVDAPIQTPVISAWITITPAGYAATDDLYLIVRGEVW